MSQLSVVRHPVAKSIMIVAVGILVFSFGLGVASGGAAATHILRLSPNPVIVAFSCLIVPTVAGAAWFRLKTHRAMSAFEGLRFATGVVAVNILLLIGGFAIGLILSADSRVLASSGFSATHVFFSYLSKTIVTWRGLFWQLLIFAQAYVLGLILTWRARRDAAPA